MYNDISVLENYHVSAGMRLIKKPEYDFMAALPPNNRAAIRELVIQLILATGV